MFRIDISVPISDNGRIINEQQQQLPEPHSSGQSQQEAALPSSKQYFADRHLHDGAAERLGGTASAVLAFIEHGQPGEWLRLGNFPDRSDFIEDIRLLKVLLGAREVEAVCTLSSATEEVLKMPTGGGLVLRERHYLYQGGNGRAIDLTLERP